MTSGSGSIHLVGSRQNWYAWDATVKNVLRSSIAFAIVLLAPSPSALSAQTSFPDWHSGAEGYEQALEQRRGTSDAILLYFYTAWCTYCRQFNQEIVPSPEMTAYLRHAIGVRVNPEAGEREKALAAQFHVTGYPTIFVIPPQTDQLQEITVSRNSPAEFIAACETVSAAHQAPKTLSAKPVASHRLSGAKSPLRVAPQPAGVVNMPLRAVAKNAVHLHNGNVLEGTVRWVNDKEIVLDVDGVGSLTLSRAEIVAIDGEVPATTNAGISASDEAATIP